MLGRSLQVRKMGEKSAIETVWGVCMLFAFPKQWQVIKQQMLGELVPEGCARTQAYTWQPPGTSGVVLELMEQVRPSRCRKWCAGSRLQRTYILLIGHLGVREVSPGLGNSLEVSYWNMVFVWVCMCGIAEGTRVMIYALYSVQRCLDSSHSAERLLCIGIKLRNVSALKLSGPEATLKFQNRPPQTPLAWMLPCHTPEVWRA